MCSPLSSGTCQPGKVGLNYAFGKYDKKDFRKGYTVICNNLVTEELEENQLNDALMKFIHMGYSRKVHRYFQKELN